MAVSFVIGVIGWENVGIFRVSACARTFILIMVAPRRGNNDDFAWAAGSRVFNRFVWIGKRAGFQMFSLAFIQGMAVMEIVRGTYSPRPWFFFLRRKWAADNVGMLV